MTELQTLRAIVAKLKARVAPPCSISIPVQEIRLILLTAECKQHRHNHKARKEPKPDMTPQREAARCACGAVRFVQPGQKQGAWVG